MRSSSRTSGNKPRDNFRPSNSPTRPHSVKQCPKCSQSVAGDSWLCECGYEFGPEPRPVAAPAPQPRPVCRFFASLLAIPVALALVSLFVLMSPAHGGSGPDVGPDLRGVLPVFTILIGGALGTILSIAGLYRRESGAGLLLAFYALAFVLTIIPK